MDWLCAWACSGHVAACDPTARAVVSSTQLLAQSHCGIYATAMCSNTCSAKHALELKQAWHGCEGAGRVP